MYYDILVEFLNFNKGLDYRIIIVAFILYLTFLWMVVVLWVYFDAKKRYAHPMHPLVVGIATFFLGIPFVLLYLLIRPEEVIDEGYSSDDVKGGVNVPLINFTGKEGIEMSLNLTISPKVRELRPNDLKIGVSVEPSDDRFEIKEIESAPVYAVRTSPNFLSDIKRGLSKIKTVFVKRPRENADTTSSLAETEPKKGRGRKKKK